MRRYFIIFFAKLNDYLCTIEYKNKRAYIIQGRLHNLMLKEIESVFKINKIPFGYVSLHKENNRFRVIVYKETEAIKQQLLNTVNIR
jgi:hypothetical protein